MSFVLDEKHGDILKNILKYRKKLKILLKRSFDTEVVPETIHNNKIHNNQRKLLWS